jgi:hypothetical protein
MICVHLRPPLASRDTFVSSKIVLKVVFLERDFERDHLAEKSNRTKMGQKIHCADPKPSSNSNLPVAWITGPATDPSLLKSLNLTNVFAERHRNSKKIDNDHGRRQKP